MSIQPIDLQTLFSHINQVGKEQAHQKNAAAVQQSLQGSELVEETRHQDESVNETKELEDEVQVVGDENEKEPGGSKKGKEEKDSDCESDKKKEVFHDPDLGRNIDITG